MMVGFGRFESPLAEPSFHMGCLELLLEEVDLTAERLALLVHRLVSVDLRHETPVVHGEFVELPVE